MGIILVNKPLWFIFQLVEKMNAFFKNVIPAEAGIQRYLNVISYVFVFTGFPPTREQAWIPASAGMTKRSVDDGLISG